jgi:hypothetical protein
MNFIFNALFFCLICFSLSSCNDSKTATPGSNVPPSGSTSSDNSEGTHESANHDERMSQASSKKPDFKCGEVEFGSWVPVVEKNDGSWSWIRLTNKKIKRSKEDCETIVQQANSTYGYFCEKGVLYNANVGGREFVDEINMAMDSDVNQAQSCEAELTLLKQFQGWMGFNVNWPDAQPVDGLFRRNSGGWDETHSFKYNPYGSVAIGPENSARIKTEILKNNGFFCYESVLWKINDKLRIWSTNDSYRKYWIGGGKIFENDSQCEQAIDSISKYKGKYCVVGDKNRGWMIDSSLDGWLELDTNTPYSAYSPAFGVDYQTVEHCRSHL